MAGYIVWLASRRDKFAACQVEQLAKLRAEVLEGGAHKRTPGNAARLAYGLKLFLEFAVDVGAIDEGERDRLWERGWSAISRYASDQAEYSGEADPARRYVDLLRSTLSSGKAHVCDRSGNMPENPQAWGWQRRSSAFDNTYLGLEVRGPRVGWIDGDHLYLDPEAALATVQQAARDAGEPLALGPRAMHKRLYEQGLETTGTTLRASLT